MGWCQNLKRRYQEHISDAKTGDKNHRCNWIRKLLKNNSLPEMIIIEETIYSLKVEKEQYWIKYYGREKLVNGTDGGEGVKGCQNRLGTHLSDETKKKISVANKGKTVSEETCKRISESKKGTQIKEKNSFWGKHHSEASKKLLSLSHIGLPSWNKGIPMTEENKKKLSKAKKEKMTDEKRKHISDGQKGRIAPTKGTKLNVERSSKYIGVYWHTQTNRWRARIVIDKKRKHLGGFYVEEDATRAYDKKCYELYGDKAKLNFPEDYKL